MANNGGRQGGGGGGNQNMNEHVEFTVKVCVIRLPVCLLCCRSSWVLF